MKEEVKTNKPKSPEFSVARVGKFLEEGLAAWKIKHLDWFLYDSFYKGNHYLQLNTNDYTIRNSPQGATIPYIYHVIRLIANEVSKISPKWEFIPNEDNPEAVETAIDMGFLMDKVFDDANISQLLRDGEKMALKFSACPYFIGWDDKEGKCIISLENPFYVIPDPRARNLQEAKYVVRIIESDLITAKSNPEYDESEVAKLQPEVKVGGTPIYERVMTETNKIYPDQANQQADNFSIFIKEFYEKVEKDGVTKIKLTVVCQNSLLYEDDTELEDYPFEFLYSDKDPLTFYGEGWAKSLISINKMINKLETQKAIYTDRVATPRYRLPRGSGIEQRIVNGIPVTFYDANLRDAPEPEPIPQWPQAADTSKQDYVGYMKDFGGMSDILLGNVPPGVEANRAIESLIEQSGNTTVEVKKNLVDFLKRLAKKTIWNYSHYLADVQTVPLADTEPLISLDPQTGEPIEVPGRDGQPMEVPRKLNVIGAETQRGKDMMMSRQADNGASYRDILFLTSDMDIKVETASEIASTQQGRWDKVMEVVGAGILPVEVAIDLLKIGPTKDIMKKFEEQKAKEMEEEAQKAEMNKAEPPPVDDKPKISIGFKDLPPVAQIEYLQQLGLYPTEEEQQAQLMQQLQMMQMGGIDPNMIQPQMNTLPQEQIVGDQITEEQIPILQG
jgi:hypothetical protein